MLACRHLLCGQSVEQEAVSGRWWRIQEQRMAPALAPVDLAALQMAAQVAAAVTAHV
jgi:hypothetical protein